MSDERWLIFALQNADDVIKQEGVAYFVENLNRYSIIALCDYFRKVQYETGTGKKIQSGTGDSGSQGSKV